MNKNHYYLIGSVVIVLLLALGGSLVQSDFGSIDISYVNIDDDGLKVTGKLYLPDTASSTTPASAVLVLHGLNNDKDTEGPTALELAKRGFVALALDERGHGDSDPGENILSGGNDTDMGANAAYQYLKSLDEVKSDSIGLVGHSMGGGSANAVAEKNPDHKAIVYQAFSPLNYSENDYLNNYLQLWPRYEESYAGSRDDFVSEGVEMIKYNLDLIGDTPRGDVYDQTYGDFADGSAQRYALIESTHPGGTWDGEGIEEVVAWMLQALEGETENASVEEANGQTYMLKEILLLLALIILIFSSVFLVNVLLELEFFKGITTEIPEQTITSGGGWWRLATINSIIGGLTYYFIPVVALVGIGISIILPIFGLLLGSVYTIWFLVNALIAWYAIRRFTRISSMSMKELGAFDKEKTEEEKMIWRKTLLLAACVFLYFLIITAITQYGFKVELRFMWSAFKILTPFRFLQFLIYVVPVYQFFRINAGTFLFGLLRLPAEETEWKTIVIWWLKAVYAMLSLIILLYIIQYIPMFLFGTRPLVEMFGLFWLFGIFLMSIIPQFILLFLLMVIFFRKTGRIYLGSFIASIIVTWILSTGVT